jgi:pentatricopeptide repeat protein
MPGVKYFSFLLLLLGLLTLSACKEDVMHRKAAGILNEKARQLAAAGDVRGAIGRLESAVDLMPGEPVMLNNLAIAYQQNNDYEKALAIFERMLKVGGVDEGETYRSIGIVHEAIADQKLRQATAAEEQPENCRQAKPAPKPAVLRQEAIEQYQAAIEAYEEGLPKLKGGQDVENQIQFLRKRIEDVRKGPDANSSQSG